MKNLLKIILCIAVFLFFFIFPQYLWADMYNSYYNQGYTGFVKTSENGVPINYYWQYRPYWSGSYYGHYYYNYYPYNNYYYNNYPYYYSYNNWYQNYPMSASCSAVYVNPQYVTWQVTVYGGRSPYSYYWSGTDNPISQNSSSINAYYTTTGLKSMNVSVSSSDGQRINAYCGSVSFTSGRYPYYYY